MPRLIIHAPNIHNGGGKILLMSILNELPPNQRVLLLKHENLNLSNNEFIESLNIKSTVYHRIKAELLLSKISKNDDNILCLGNLPPLFKTNGKVKVFIQNRFLIDKVKVLKMLPIRVQFKILIERMWLKFRQCNACEILVQTKTMALLAKNVIYKPIKIHGFIRNKPLIENNNSNNKKFDFIYVASDDAHKNHNNLLLAFSILADEGHYPSLLLTISSKYESILSKNISNYVNLNVTNIGKVNHDQLFDYYSKSKALIYPSLIESFGIPLIEAGQIGIPIIASELDYTYDVCNPAETFNPNCPISISNSIKKFLKIKSNRNMILSPNKFVKIISSN